MLIRVVATTTTTLVAASGANASASAADVAGIVPQAVTTVAAIIAIMAPSRAFIGSLGRDRRLILATSESVIIVGNRVRRWRLRM